jgi:diguanylate cyclase (GGDEF)-like protein
MRQLAIRPVSVRRSDRPTTTRETADLAPWCGGLVAVMAVTVLLYGIDIMLHPLGPVVSEQFQKFAACAICICAAVLCVMKGRLSGGERAAWWLLALAMALWGSASVYYSIFLWDRAVMPIPSLADGFWLAFYLPAYAGLFGLMRKRAGAVGRSARLDAAVGGLGVGGAAAAVVFQSVVDNTTGTALASATNLAYPIGDIGLLALVVAAVTVTGWKGSGAWRWIASAFAIFALTDCVWLVQISQGDYTVGGILDLGWPAAFLLVGLAAWRTDSRGQPSERVRTAMVVPALSGVTALALLVAGYFVRTNPVALTLATASIVVILVRLYLALRDNSRMLAYSRVEAMTDALTGLGNRRQLAADLAAHLEELDPARPLALTLFDLDGFKFYNDTFGHPAGDQLLTRLGGRLSDLVAGRGTAYRMGGDEFCMLWVCPDGDEASVITMEAAAVAALSERGEAFAIGSSYGSALLPQETTDAEEALGMADRRMYIRKRGGRASAGQQSSDVLQCALAECDSSLDAHHSHVAALAYASAVRLGIPSEDAEITRQTAQLHDVGKVAVPDAILNKPGRLDDAEWAFMKRHTIIGERIISAAPALSVVAKLVRSTHERYDGGGYPDGLAGAEIPLIARIVYVCDSYDAMVTKRAYRDARSHSGAIAELRRCSGTQFDPQVVDAVIGALEAGEGAAQPALQLGAS